MRLHLEGKRSHDAVMRLFSRRERSCSSFRRPVKVCGSDGLNMNGKNGLARLSDFGTQSRAKIVTRPGLRRSAIWWQIMGQHEKIAYLLNNDKPSSRAFTDEQRKTRRVANVFLPVVVQPLSVFWVESR